VNEPLDEVIAPVQPEILQLMYKVLRLMFFGLGFLFIDNIPIGGGEGLGLGEGELLGM
jgi:hypothetical protein